MEAHHEYINNPTLLLETALFATEIKMPTRAEILHRRAKYHAEELKMRVSFPVKVNIVTNMSQ